MKSRFRWRFVRQTAKWLCVVIALVFLVAQIAELLGWQRREYGERFSLWTQRYTFAILDTRRSDEPYHRPHPGDPEFFFIARAVWLLSDDAWLPRVETRDGNWILVVPYWLPLATSALPAAFLLWWDRRGIPPGLCPHCRYNLQGLLPNSPCPECGKARPA